MRRAAKIDVTHREIVDGLRAIGAGVTYIQAAGGASGCADLLVSHRARWFVLEAKAKRGDLGESQVRWIGQQRAPVHVVRSIDDALDAIGAARGCPR